MLPDLHRALGLIADHYASLPREDLLPQVMARAMRIRRRRRAIRAGSATAVLVLTALLGPSIASEWGMRGGDASAAPPPSAIVDLTSAYPVPAAGQSAAAVATPTQPENALQWPSRGAAVPGQAVDVAKSYLLEHVKPAATAPGETGAEAATTTATTTATTAATVTTLWSQVDEDTTAAVPAGKSATPKGTSQKARKTWLYVMQGWTNGPDGTPSRAQLMVGDYTQTGKTSSMSVYTTPVTFAHVRPGSADDADDARQIAELSVWLPQSDRLVVLGAPQAATVLYAKDGGDLVPEKTVDGVAVFPRTHQLVKGRYADAIQVRDAKNVALTPPKAWSAGDFALTGAMSLWSSAGAGAGWVTVPARGGGARSTPAPGATPGLAVTPEPALEPSTEPGTEPPGQTLQAKPTAVPSVAVTSGK